jgi:predicted negative regulator of RcsB-dependent stress response
LTDYLTEQEQVELLKKWIKQYSLVIVAGVALSIIIILSWHFWQDRRDNTIHHASAVYDEMLTMRVQNSQAATIVQANKLFTHYAASIYGQMAAFMLARDAIFKKDYAVAEKHLNWVLTHSRVTAFKQIARLRLARLFISLQRPKQALQILKKKEDSHFNGLTYEIEGDAYLALNDIISARNAYQEALMALPNAEIVRPLLQMKYDNLITN